MELTVYIKNRECRLVPSVPAQPRHWGRLLPRAPRLPLSRCPCLSAHCPEWAWPAGHQLGESTASSSSRRAGRPVSDLALGPALGILRLVASVRAPPGTPAPRQAQTEMLSPTLSGDGLEAERTEAIWANRATISREGSKPVWASSPHQNPPQAQGRWCLRFPQAAPFCPQRWPLRSPGNHVLAAGTRGKHPLAVPSSGRHPPVMGAPVGSSLRHWGSLWRGAPWAGPACAPSWRCWLCWALPRAHANPPLSSHSISARPSAFHPVTFP